jgi:L-lactate dehydrogenase complex protein LldG
VERAIKNNIPAVRTILENHKDLKAMADEVRRVKLNVLDNLDYYIDQTVKSVEKTGGTAHVAKTKGDAIRIVTELVGKRNNIILSKSNVALEVGIREHLTSIGKDVWETDLGEYILQIAEDSPSHIVAPALHFTKEQVGQLLNRKLDRAINENSTHEQMVASVREFLLSKYLKAEVGITGANAVAADTGSVALLENEGNIRMVTILPSIHIAITGIDKIVPSLKDAMLETMVQSGYGGLYPPSYINITSGPSSTADIEFKRVVPATGPREFHLILLDNGRTMANKDPELREALLCIKCGRCYFSCPVYRALGKDWVKPPYGGPTGAMWTAIVDRDMFPANLCTHSGGCKEVCPVGINIPRVLEHIKEMSLGGGSSTRFKPIEDTKNNQVIR